MALMAWLPSGIQAAGNSAGSALAYETLIAPIFRARCIECHGEHKQKAKLALHEWDAVLRGSEAGPVFVAGQPGESVLIERLRRPVADEEHMPPEDRPQPGPEEISLLEHWIKRGASRSVTVSELLLPDPLAKAAAELPARLAALERAHAPVEPRWEFDATAVTRVRAPLAAAVEELQLRFPGALSYESRTSGALHFTAVGLGRDFGDSELAALAPLHAELVFLDLSGTSITDRSAAMLATFSSLRVLRAGFTSVGDETARAIAALPNLQSVALPETKVTAASVGALARMPALRVLRLAGTSAQAAAQAANLPVIPAAADFDSVPATRN